MRWLIGLLLALPLTVTAADHIAAAVGNESRPAADIKLDPMRKPAAVLAFFEVTPGTRVLDIFAGGGYYTEIISYAVGSEGNVTLYNNAPWDGFVGKGVTERLKGNRLPNVERVVLAPSELGELEGGYDTAIFVLGMHDLYYADADNGWPAINVQAFLKQMFELVNPGGLLGVIDHNADTGTDAETVSKDLHRIDPAIIIRDLTEAGFELEATSDLLANPDDDRQKLVFDNSIRWKSDRSVLRFRKPQS